MGLTDPRLRQPVRLYPILLGNQTASTRGTYATASQAVLNIAYVIENSVCV